METKRIKLYFLVLFLLCITTALSMHFFRFNLNENDLPIPVMVTFTIPAFCCILSLLSTNGFKNFRLDIVGVVGSCILGIAFGILMFLSYFILGYALSYPQYTRPDTAIVLAICSIVGTLPVIALHDTLRKNRMYIKEHGPQPGKIWRNLQYATFLAATLLLLFTFLPGTKDDGYLIMYAEYDVYGAGCFGVQTLFIGLSLSLALVMLLAGWLWKQARIASVLSVILLAICIIYATIEYLHETSGTFDGVQLSRYTYSSYNIQQDPESDLESIMIYGDGDETEGDSQEDYDDEYDREENSDAYRPKFIGDGIIGTEHSRNHNQGDTDSIHAAVRYLVRNMNLTDEYCTIPYLFPDGLLPYLERSTENAFTKAPGSYAYDGLIKMLWKYRKSMVIDGVFSLYSYWVKKAMSKKEYQENGYELLVRQMISAYEDLEKNPAAFSEVYESMDERIYNETSGIHDAYQKYYDLLKKHISAESYQLIFRECNDEEDDTYNGQIADARCKAVWIYSFWGRRNKERICETVYKTLVKLDKLYQ